MYPFYSQKKKNPNMQIFTAVHGVVQFHSLSNPNQQKISLKCKAISCVGDYFTIPIQNPFNSMEMYCTLGCVVSIYLIQYNFTLTSRAALCKTSRWSSKSFCKTSS